MKIGQPTDSLVSKQVGGAAAVQKAAQGNPSTLAANSAAQAPRTAGVAVTVSTMARGIDRAALGDAAADIDAKKVAAIKASIQDGSYTVNPEAIADKLLADTKEMIDRTTQ